MQAIYMREQILVNTDPQRRCYNGCNYSEELVWTPWEKLESERFLEQSDDPNRMETRLSFWKTLNPKTSRQYKLDEE